MTGVGEGGKACAMCEDADVDVWCEQCRCYFCDLVSFMPPRLSQSASPRREV